MVLVIICLVFVVTHIPRLILAIEAFMRAAGIARCYRAGLTFVAPLSLVCLESVSNLLILINASCNFIIYCLASTHFKVFLHRKFAKEVRHSTLVADSVAVQQQKQHQRQQQQEEGAKEEGRTGQHQGHNREEGFREVASEPSASNGAANGHVALASHSLCERAKTTSSPSNSRAKTQVVAVLKFYCIICT